MGDQVHHAERVGGVFDQGKKVVDPALDVALAHAEGDLLVEHGLHRQHVGLAGVHPAERNGPAAAHQIDRGVDGREAVETGLVHHLLREGVGQEPHRALRQLDAAVAVGLHADGIHDSVGPATLGEVDEFVDHAVGEVVGQDAVTLGHRSALGLGLDREDAIPQVHADAGGELSDRPQPHHRQGSPFGDVRVLHALPGGGDDVAEEEVAVVGQVVADADVVVVGQRHAQVFGLTTGDLPVELRVSEERRSAAVLPHLRRLALRLQTPAAHEAVAARDVERDDDAVADGEVRHGRSHLDDDAHRLVPEHVALVDERSEEFVQVQVGAADRGRGDLHDRVGGLEDLRVGHLLDAHGALALPGQCLHGGASRSGGRSVCGAIRAKPRWLTNRGSSVTRRTRRAAGRRSTRARGAGTRRIPRGSGP